MACVWLSIRAHSIWPRAVLPPWSVPAGVAVFAAGIVLRWYSIIHLGRFFTVNVAIAADHQLVDTGPYRFVRHPSYTGALLAFVGFGMVMRNWASVLVISMPVALALPLSHPRRGTRPDSGPRRALSRLYQADEAPDSVRVLMAVPTKASLFEIGTTWTRKCSLLNTSIRLILIR